MTVKSLGQLTIDLLLKTGQFVEGMTQAERTAARKVESIKRNAAAFGVAAGAALTGVAVAVSSAVRNSIDQMDELSKAAQRAAMPTEELSKLAYAGNLADVALSDLTGSMGRLIKSQAAALDTTSEQANVFKALGISVTDATGKLRKGSEVLYDFADAFKDQEGSPEVVAAGMAVFGRSFQNLIPLIKDGSKGLREAGDEAERLGLVISGETGRAAEQFNDDFTRLQSAARGFSNALAAELLPDLTELTAGFVAASQEGGGFADEAHMIAQGIRGVGDAAEWAAGKLGEYITWLKERGAIEGDTIAQLEARRDALVGQRDSFFSNATGSKPRIDAEIARVDNMIAKQTGPFAGVTATATYYESDETTAKKMRERAETARRLRELAFGDPAKGSKGAGSGKTAVERDADRAAESMARYAAQAEIAAAALNGPFAEAKARADQQAKEWRKEVEAGNMTLASEKILLAASAAELERRRAEMELQQQAPKALLDTMSGELRLLGMIGPARERYARQLQNESEMRRAIAESIAAGNTALRDSPDMQAQLVDEARAFADWSLQVEEAAANAEQWAGIVAGSIDDAAGAFADFAVDGMRDFKGFFDELGDIAKRGLADVIREIARQKIVIPIQTRIMDSLSGSGSGGGIWNSLLGMFQGKGFSVAGQSTGNLAGLLSRGGTGALAGLGGGSSVPAVTSLRGFGNNLDNFMGMAGGGAAATGTTAATGAAGVMGSIASFMPYAALIMAGMQMAGSAYKDGFGLQYQDKSDLLLRGNLMTGGLATPLMLDSMSLDRLGRMLGMSSKTAAIFSGSSLLGKAFGRSAPKVTASGIAGTYGFGGFDGSAWADVKQKGGWFRSDKRWTQWGAIQPEVDRAFDMAVDRIGKGAEELAKQLGVDVSEQLKRVKVNIGKLQLDSDPEKARQQIEKAIDDMVGNLAGQAVKTLGFGHLLDDGFGATEVMTTLSATISLVTGSAEGLGRALESWELGNITKGVEYFMELAEKNGTTLDEERQRVVGLLGNYSDLMTDVRGELLTAGLSDAQKAALNIETTYRQQVQAANEYAKALGLTGARAEDLAKIEELRAVNMASLQHQIEAQRKSILEDLAIGQYSPLNDQQKLGESMDQLREAVANGDAASAAALSQSVLGLGRNLYASGADYNALYDQVTGLIGGMGVPSLTADDGTSMGDLADILLGLPKDIASAMFALASGATPKPLPPATPPATPTGGSGQVQSGNGSGTGTNDSSVLADIRDILYGIANESGRAGADRALDRLRELNRARV